MAKNLEIPFLLDFYGEMLTQKQHDCLVYYYEEDLSLSEIAENEGISRQGVRDSIKRAEAQLFDMEERLGLAKRFNEMKKGIDRMAYVRIPVRIQLLRCIRFRTGSTYHADHGTFGGSGRRRASGSCSCIPAW